MSPGQQVATLSGGNQQKVVIAKWLERGARVVLCDEPTRGIDVGARYEIYEWIRRMASEAKAVLLISSELEEVLGMGDRVLVMHEGRIRGEIADPGSADPAEVLRIAAGIDLSVGSLLALAGVIAAVAAPRVRPRRCRLRRRPSPGWATVRCSASPTRSCSWLSCSWPLTC